MHTFPSVFFCPVHFKLLAWKEMMKSGSFLWFSPPLNHLSLSVPQRLVSSWITAHSLSHLSPSCRRGGHPETASPRCHQVQRVLIGRLTMWLPCLSCLICLSLITPWSPNLSSQSALCLFIWTVIRDAHSWRLTKTRPILNWQGVWVEKVDNWTHLCWNEGLSDPDWCIVPSQTKVQDPGSNRFFLKTFRNHWPRVFFCQSKT